MKRSTIATTALALAASVFAGSSFATGVTVTNVFEDFSATLDLANGQTRNNLTWQNSGNDNESAVNTTTQKLDIDTGDGLVTATLTTNDVNEALAANETATFSADVKFFPAAEHPSINPGEDLKFALYAFAGIGSTNLYVQCKDATNNVGSIDCSVSTKVTVTFTGANKFKVKIGNGADSAEYDFIKSGDLSKVEFQGNGTVDDVTLAYTSTLAKNENIDIGNTGSASHPLTEDEADYLNNLVAKEGKAAVADKLASVTEADFEKASLLNQDIMEEGAASADFSITSIKRTGNSVTVIVKLVRNGDILGKVNGTVALYTCETPNGTYTPVAKFKTALESNAKTAMATNTFASVTAPFFQVKIVDSGDNSVSGLPAGTPPSNE